MSFSLRLQRLHNWETLCLSICFSYSWPCIGHIIILVICDICVLEIHLASQKMLDHVGWRSSFKIHLLTFGMMFVPKEVSAFLYSLCIMYVLRLDTEPSC